MNKFHVLVKFPMCGDRKYTKDKKKYTWEEAQARREELEKYGARTAILRIEE